MRDNTRLKKSHTWLLCFRNNKENLKDVLILFVVILLPLVLGCVFNNEDGKVYESICIVATSSGKELLMDYGVIHNGKYYPLVGDKRDGCLILFSYYAHDHDGDGVKDRGYEYARFVDDDYDHCCVNGQ